MNPKTYIKKAEEKIRKKIGGKKALCATSGGVDSMTCAVLAHRVLKNRLKLLFIDDGLMRQDEGKTVKKDLAKLGIKLEILSAEKQFFSALKGKIDPEEKRKAFRNIFYRTLGGAIKKNRAEFLIQGTIAADVKETKAGVKTQHNVLEQIGLNPERFGFQVIEPLVSLYKDEVRKVARALGLPAKYYQRMPFPGPGLATRIVGEVTPKRTAVVRRAVKIVEEETVHLKPFQAFAVLLSDRATGIIKGKRMFGEIVAVRSVESEKALRAEATNLPWKVLKKIQKRIIREIPSVTKVLYDLTPKPPSTIEYI